MYYKQQIQQQILEPQATNTTGAYEQHILELQVTADTGATGAIDNTGAVSNRYWSCEQQILELLVTNTGAASDRY